MYPTERARQNRQRHGRGVGMVKTTEGRKVTYKSWFERDAVTVGKQRLSANDQSGWGREPYQRFVSPWAPPPAKVVPYPGKVGGGTERLPDDFHDPEDKRDRDWDKWAEELEKRNRDRRYRYDPRPNPARKLFEYSPARRGYWVAKATFQIGEIIISPDVPFDPDPYGVGSAVTSDGWWHPWAEMRRCSANSGAGKWQNPAIAQHCLSSHSGGGSLNCTTTYVGGSYTKDAPEGDPCNLDQGARRVTATGKISDSYQFINWGQIDCSDPDLDPGWTQLNPDNLPDTPGATVPLDNWPMEFPETAPVGRPGQPQPQRWKEAKPRPGEQPSSKPRPRAAANNPPVIPAPVTIVETEVQPKPDDQVIDFTTVPGGTMVRTRLRPNSAQAKKPPRGTRQFKGASVITVAPKAWAMINLATEAVDFVDAMHDALPKECKSKGDPVVYKRKDGKGFVFSNKKLDPMRKLGDIYRCWDHFDKDKAIENYVNNQIEDFAYGAVNTGKASKDLGVTTGADRATRIGERATSDAYDERDEEAPRIELPKVVYDQPSGQWRLEFQQWSYGDTVWRGSVG